MSTPSRRAIDERTGFRSRRLPSISLVLTTSSVRAPQARPGAERHPHVGHPAQRQALLEAHLRQRPSERLQVVAPGRPVGLLPDVAFFAAWHAAIAWSMRRVGKRFAAESAAKTLYLPTGRAADSTGAACRHEPKPCHGHETFLGHVATL